MEEIKWIEILKYRRKLEDIGRMIITPKCDNAFILIESINTETLSDEIFLVYDCTNLNDTLEFKYDAFNETWTELECLPEIVLIFKTWDDERKTYFNFYKKLKKASKKKEFSEFFEKKISIYTACTDIIVMDIADNGINYLQYSNEKAEIDEKLEGFVYNISFYELKKLFNVTGAYLFNQNVRYGLKKNSIGEKLKNKFRTYLNVSLEKEILNQNPSLTEEQRESIKEVFIPDSTQGLEDTELLAENFWFYHNGISIFCYGAAKVETPANKLILPTHDISVINGAQTLTNFFSEVEFIENGLMPSACETANVKNVENLINSVLKKIFVKTIIITGESKFVRGITHGLNTQIPILEEALFANSSLVNEINTLLISKRSKIKILKEGEMYSKEGGLNVLDFAKHWLTISNKPGESKNLGKIKLQAILKIAKIDLEASYTKSEVKMEMLLTIYEWWDNTKKSRLQACGREDNLEAICRYGKNYFGTYVINYYELTNEIDESTLMIMYDYFEKSMLSLKPDYSLSDFKKDEYSAQMLEKIKLMKVNSEKLSSEETSKAISISSLFENAEMKKELITILNKPSQSEYTYSKTISHFLSKNKIFIDYFRVISIEEGKCKEAFPFPNSTFNELIDVSADNRVNFENSSFYKSIVNKFAVFVIEKQKNSNHVKGIDFINEFSFEDYIHEAEEVFKITIDAFNEGDESKFVKSSRNLKFHIRPKAINAEDTFEFSNGDFITKRTFWANKTTVEELINKKLSKQ